MLIQEYNLTINSNNQKPVISVQMQNNKKIKRRSFKLIFWLAMLNDYWKLLAKYYSDINKYILDLVFIFSLFSI